ncbi:hypothetical protein PVNG_02410 [Plasmodium vivax North Korean]|uniref:Translation elongation factor P/YeiP central domain-containing protein n=1 Tax=Plasmodium vivax North Korean TaxID=1035514 RepID=A0A0J9TNE5_PLAVI|nr:hypothetical protein PVNG_02410 [Plasmodium vivax North Korean]
MIEARELRSGQTILLRGIPHMVLDHSFNKTAMRGGIVKCKLKNLLNKSIFTEELSNLRLERANLRKQEVIFTHKDGDHLKFCDTQTYEEYSLLSSDYSDKLPYLEEGLSFFLVFLYDLDEFLEEDIEVAEVIQVEPLESAPDARYIKDNKYSLMCFSDSIEKIRELSLSIHKSVVFFRLDKITKSRKGIKRVFRAVGTFNSRDQIENRVLAESQLDEILSKLNVGTL